MLFRLSRVSFWLAAAAAALALLAPDRRVSLLAAISMSASAAAFAFWRSGVSVQRQSQLRVSTVPPAPDLSDAALTDAATALVREAHAAPSFEAALHAVARVLRAELGARRVAVAEVCSVDATHALVADLIELQPGFRPVPRRVRLGASPLARAIQSRVEVAAAPDAVVVPAVTERVVALIELGGLELTIEPQALAGLLALARLTLSGLAAPVPAESSPPRVAGPLQGHVLVMEDTIVNPERASRLLRRLGCQVTLASGMLHAWDALGRTQFDLVVVDLQGAGTVGPRDTGAGGLAGFVQASRTPVVAITEAGTAGEGPRLRELGFDDHVCKPLRQRQMLTLLSKYLRPRAAAESGGSMSPDSGLPPAPVLDAGALARLGELDPTGENKLLERVLKAFQTSAARLQPQAVAARASGDQAGLRLVAHTLKSSSASIGAMHLSEVCAQIEATIREARSDDLEPQLDALDAALASVLQAIDQLLQERE